MALNWRGFERELLLHIAVMRVFLHLQKLYVFSCFNIKPSTSGGSVVEDINDVNGTRKIIIIITGSHSSCSV